MMGTEISKIEFLEPELFGTFSRLGIKGSNLNTDITYRLDSSMVSISNLKNRCVVLLGSED